MWLKCNTNEQIIHNGHINIMHTVQCGGTIHMPFPDVIHCTVYHKLKNAQTIINMIHALQRWIGQN